RREVVDHENEADHRPSSHVAWKVHMEPLCGASRSYRPCVHGAEFEGLFDDATTCLKHRRIQVQFVERCVTLAKVPESRCRPAHLYVIGGRTGYCLIEQIGQFRQTC